MNKLTVKELLIPAFRYYLGRKTIAVHGFIDALVESKDELEEWEIELICREIKEHERHFDLGHEMDRRKWYWLIRQLSGDIRKKPTSKVVNNA